MRLTTPCPCPPSPDAYVDGRAACAHCDRTVHDVRDRNADALRDLAAAQPDLCARWLALPGGHLTTRPLLLAAVAAVAGACGSDVLADTDSDDLIARVIDRVAGWPGPPAPEHLRPTVTVPALARTGAQVLGAAILDRLWPRVSYVEGGFSRVNTSL